MTKSGASAPSGAIKDESEDDSDFEDPDLIEIPGGGKSLQNLKSDGDSMPSLGGNYYTY